MAASVAAVEGQADCSSKSWNSSLRPLSASKKRFDSITDSSDDGFCFRGDVKEEKRNQTEESLQRVMYLNCWVQT